MEEPTRAARAGHSPSYLLPNNPGRAVLFMLGAVILLPMINACAKFLGEYSIFQIAWARYAGHFAFMLAVFAPQAGVGLLRSSQLKLQLVRSGLHGASVLLTFYALRYVSLPTATAISFTAPLMITALAPIFLGERVRGAHWVAVIIGFIGALVLVRPNEPALLVPMLLLLLNACASAIIQLLSRRLAQNDSAATSNTYMVLVGFVVMSLCLPFVWEVPRSWLDAAVFGLAGISGALGHYLLVRAYEVAPAAFVSPFNYGQLLGATLLSALIFDQLPDVWTWVGAAIIAGSGLFILLRERSRPDDGRA